MVYEKQIIKQIDTIQFDGSNIKEVFDFICKYKGNANDIKFEELEKRPDIIPLDVDSSSLYYKLNKELSLKYQDQIEKYKLASIYANEEDFFPKEFFKERETLRLYEQDWRRNELYHIYLDSGNDRCHLEGIHKGDWFVYDNRVERYSNESFNRFIKENGWHSCV